MDIEDFYDGNSRRRWTNVKLGDEWYDASGRRWFLYWASQTGEVFAMAAPLSPGVVDRFGNGTAMPSRAKDLRTFVVAVFPTERDVHEALRSVIEPGPATRQIEPALCALRDAASGDQSPGLFFGEGLPWQLPAS